MGAIARAQGPSRRWDRLNRTSWRKVAVQIPACCAMAPKLGEVASLTDCPSLHISRIVRTHSLCVTRLQRRMAAPALGVGDIAKALKLTYDGARALREDKDGARAHFQQATTALAHRTRAVEHLVSDLQASTTASNQAALDTYAPLLAEDTALQTKIAQFGPSLGRGAKTGLHHGIGRKLKYHFEDDKQIREHYERTRPAVDAAVLQTLRYIVANSASGDD
jgi:hypothetical protein